MNSLESFRLRWQSDAPDWPNREASRFVEAAGLRWHVQIMGTGPDLLLLHGAGGSTHGWGALLPALSRSYRVVAPDLPGHAFTEALPPERCGLEELATAVTRFLDATGTKPEGIVAHSAGAAMALSMILDGRARPERWAFLAPSLVRPTRGAPPPVIQDLLSPALQSAGMARLSAAVAGRRGVVDALLASTGSRVPATSRSIYRRLSGNPAHLGSVLRILSMWEPEPLAARFPEVTTPGLLLAPERDGWIPLDELEPVARSLPAARFRVLPGLGHLAHEEAPERVLDLLLPWLLRGEVPPDEAGPDPTPS
jgi:magnesium chelatase accessory protein